MPRLYQKTARQDIWRTGVRTSAVNNKQGFTIDRSQPNRNADQEVNDRLLVKKGQKYFTWHPKSSPWQYSINKPDLRSAWEIEIADYNDEISGLEYGSDDDNIEEEEQDSNRENLKTRIEERQDELQSNLDNMPEQLQESSVLNERIEQLDELLQQLEEQ